MLNRKVVKQKNEERSSFDALAYIQMEGKHSSLYRPISSR